MYKVIVTKVVAKDGQDVGWCDERLKDDITFKQAIRLFCLRMNRKVGELAIIDQETGELMALSEYGSKKVDHMSSGFFEDLKEASDEDDTVSQSRT